MAREASALTSLLGMLIAVLPAYAQDLAPRVDHTPVTSAPLGTAIEIRALIASPTGQTIFEPALFVRLPGLPRFTRVAMNPDAQIKDLFVATLSASLVTGDFDYYLEAFDSQGNGPGRTGSPEHPWHVTIAAPPPSDRPVQLVLAPPLSEPPRPRSHSLTANLGLFGGLVTSAGLAAGWMLKMRADQFEAARSNGVSFSAEEYQAGKSFTLLANIPLAIGGALLTGALVSALWPDPEPPAAPAAPKVIARSSVGDKP